MSTNLAIAKIASIATVGVGSVAGVGYFVHKKWAFEKIPSDFIVVTEATSSSDQPSSTMFSSDEEKKQQFKCKLVGSDVSGDHFDDYCFVSSVNIPNNKHWIGKSDLISVPSSDSTTISKTSFNTANSFFKVKVSSEFANKYHKSYDENKKIELIPKDPSTADNNKKFADLTPLFSYKNGKTIGKTEYILAKTKEVSSITLATSPSPKCSLVSLADAASKTSSNCSISTFTTGTSSEDNLSSLVFSKNDTAISTSTQLINNKYYLIKFTSSSNSKIDMSNIASKNVYVQVTTTGSTNTTQNITLDLITPVVISPNTASSMNAFLVN